MPDDITLPPSGTGTATPGAATHQLADGKHVQLVGAAGAPSIAHNQVSVGTSATAIVAARARRRSVTIVNHGTTDVYVGGTGVTTGNGVLLPGTKGAAITIETTAAVSAVVGSGTQTVSYFEEYAGA